MLGVPPEDRLEACRVYDNLGGRLIADLKAASGSKKIK